MKASDVRAKTADQLNDELAALKKEQFNLRFQKATGQLEKTARVRAGPQGHRAHQDHRGARKPPPRRLKDQRHAEAHPAGHRRQRQERQDVVVKVERRSRIR